MKTVKTIIGGKEFYLLYNAEAFFVSKDKFGDENIFNILETAGRDGFINLAKIAAILAEQGELTRRYYGYDKSEIPTEDYIRFSTGFLDMAQLRHDVQNAIILGINREIDEPEKEVDLVLQELEKKTGAMN